jgi:hypothetical protein
MVLAGPDPSAKKDKEVFLVDLSSETELRKNLSSVGFYQMERAKVWPMECLILWRYKVGPKMEVTVGRIPATMGWCSSERH